MASSDPRISKIESKIRSFPDFPKEGILFRDIFSVCEDPVVFGDLINVLVEHIQNTHQTVEVIVGLEARGFIFGPILAQRLQCSFVPIRKKGKLPGECVNVSYELEYGVDVFEAQKGAIREGQGVIIIDDLLATGGTMNAACNLMEKMSGKVLECLVVIELVDLKGRNKLKHPLYSVVSFGGH